MKNRIAHLSALAREGAPEHVDYLFSLLNNSVDIATTKVVDYCLGLFEKEEGVERIKYYLFNGTQMERNYCTLYFARRNDWETVNKAYDMGLVDYKQAYSR